MAYCPWVRNLTDEEYITEVYQDVGFGFYISDVNYSDPRTFVTSPVISNRLLRLTLVRRTCSHSQS